MRFIVAILFILLNHSTVIFAQTQQGVVKTRGRMVNGQLVAGQRLTGATVTLNFGNPLVSGNQGLFSFNVPSGKNYSLVAAKKQGYTLADPEYTRRSFSYSASDPFYVVLEDEAQRQADINAATRKVRRTLTAQLEKREEEIEALKNHNKLSESEYQKRLQELYDNQSKSEQLVKEMAERYASTDYDQLDEFNRQVQMYIEIGELQKGDSMIRSKGDMERRVEKYRNIIDANEKERETLRKREKQLQKSEIVAAKTYEDLSQDLYRYSEIFFQAHKRDSALYYLKMRADLDTTNLQAVKDYAKEAAVMESRGSEKYYHICLRAYQKNNDLPNSAEIEYCLGQLYMNNLFDMSKSEQYSLQALRNRMLLFEQDSDVYRMDLAVTQRDLGLLYHRLHKCSESVEYQKKALENIEVLFKQSPDIYRKEMEYSQHWLGDTYKDCFENYAKSEEYYNLSLRNSEILFDSNPDTYRDDLISIQLALGNLYLKTKNYAKAVEYLEKGLDNSTQLYDQKKNDLASIYLSQTQTSLGSAYYALSDYENSEKYYKLSIESLNGLFLLYPALAEIMAGKKYALARLYIETCRYEEAQMVIDEVINISLIEAHKYYNTKGEILLKQGKNDEALAMWKKVLELNPNFLQENPDGTELLNGLKKLGLIE